ncbi:MAG: Ser-Thr-rich GPI-anchored membrane family protein [Patescibacteria group bacterium]
MNTKYLLFSVLVFSCFLITNDVSAETGQFLTLTASPDTIDVGQSSTISWTTNASFCNAPSLFEGSAWGGGSGSYIVIPDSTKTYDMTCYWQGGGGSLTKSVTINVSVPQLFGFSFPTSDTNLIKGSTYTISWINDNAGSYGYTAYLGTGVATNGSNLETIIRTIGAVNSNARNEFSWTVPSDLSPRSDYRIEFRSPGGGGGVSAPFTISRSDNANPAPSPIPTPTLLFLGDSERLQKIAQLQTLLIQLIQQLIVLLQQ